MIFKEDEGATPSSYGAPQETAQVRGLEDPGTGSSRSPSQAFPPIPL
jgi:hypothetical protein